MKNKNRNIFIMILMTTLFLTACKKYEEGPMFSVLSKKARVANTWKMEKVLINGIEIDISLYALYTIKFDKDGKFTETWGLQDYGKWEFGDKKETLELTYDDDPSVKYVYTIIRLKNKELWFQETENNITTETHLIPN